ncbi:hypothetical protein [Streptomyces sp. AM6-12]|uniref:hypothetical protein n=1 Tax=Streptomyces sp. AM6-12 TaxID=3345149 RepID=UPI0037B95CE0
MADEQDKWLNPRTAERLLHGEPLESVDPSARDQAERLGRVLGALAAEAAPATGELPGEQAALAAFRKAREAAADERTAALAASGPGRRTRTDTRAGAAGTRGHDGGLVRIGAPTRTGAAARRPRWGRPVRLALAAVVAAGTLGGVAVAAGSGVLPTPFDVEKPGPAVTATADASSRPSAPATPRASGGIGVTGGGADSGPSAGSGASGGSGGPDRAGTTDGRTGTDSGSGPSSPPGGGLPDGGVGACRDLRSGTGLNADRRRALENLAGGSARLAQYCKLILAAGDQIAGNPAQGKGREHGGRGSEQGQGQGRGRGSGQGGKGQGGGQGGDDESHPGRGHGTGPRHGRGGGDGKGGGKAGGGRGHGGDPVGKVRIRHRGPTAPAPEHNPAHNPKHHSAPNPAPAPRGHGGSATSGNPRPGRTGPVPAPAR